jgi:hypothetical protein
MAADGRRVAQRMSGRLIAFAAALLTAASALAQPSAPGSLAAPMKEVEKIRGLKFQHDVAHRTIDRSELPARMREQLAKSLPYPPEELVTILRALQLVDPQTKNVLDKMIDLYEQQVLAYYDPQTHVYYSLSSPPPSAAEMDADLLADTVEIHELTHALQDQVFQAGVRDEKVKDDTDGSMAYHSLLEGEATLVMMASTLGKLGKSVDDLVGNDMLLSVLSEAAAADKSMATDTPKYFTESLKFPYLEGLRFCVMAYRKGGWKMLDRVHANPPRTTREVLHPDEYFARLDGKSPVPAVFDDSARNQSNVLTVEHLGEFHWRFLLGAEASKGWVDDRVVVTQDAACRTTVSAETRWENATRATAFRDAYVAFLRDRAIEPMKVASDGSIVRVEYLAE